MTEPDATDAKLPPTFPGYLRALDGKPTKIVLATGVSVTGTLRVHGDYVTLEGKTFAIPVAAIAWAAPGG